jgi:hypothetical protein
MRTKVIIIILLAMAFLVYAREPQERQERRESWSERMHPVERPEHRPVKEPVVIPPPIGGGGEIIIPNSGGGGETLPPVESSPLPESFFPEVIPSPKEKG